jgi:hypothetical protein
MLMKNWEFLCCRNFVSQITAFRMLNCELEVIFKNGILHFQREFFGKNQMHIVRAFEPF